MAKKTSPTVDSVTLDFSELILSDQVSAFKAMDQVLKNKVVEFKKHISEKEDAIDKLSEVVEVKD